MQQRIDDIRFTGNKYQIIPEVQLREKGNPILIGHRDAETEGKRREAFGDGFQLCVEYNS